MWRDIDYRVTCPAPDCDLFISVACGEGPAVKRVFSAACELSRYPKLIMSVPTIALDELSKGIQDPVTNATCKKVLEGILNDFMDLQYGKETPYTTGKQVVPTGSTLDDVEKSIADDTTEKPFKDVFTKISETEKSGDRKPQSENDGTWDSKLKPVLVLVSTKK